MCAEATCSYDRRPTTRVYRRRCLARTWSDVVLGPIGSEAGMWTSSFINRSDNAASRDKVSEHKNVPGERAPLSIYFSGLLDGILLVSDPSELRCKAENWHYCRSRRFGLKS